jgi:hypothetical protein
LSKSKLIKSCRAEEEEEEEEEEELAVNIVFIFSIISSLISSHNYKIWNTKCLQKWSYTY